LSLVNEQFKTEKEFRRNMARLVAITWPTHAACAREMGVEQSQVFRYLRNEREGAELERRLLKRFNVQVTRSNVIVMVDADKLQSDDKVNF